MKEEEKKKKPAKKATVPPVKPKATRPHRGLNSYQETLMRWPRFPADGAYDLEDSTSGEVTITMVGTAVLGYLGPDA